MKRLVAFYLNLCAVFLWCAVLSGPALSGAYVPFPVAPLFQTVGITGTSSLGASTRGVHAGGSADNLILNVPSAGLVGLRANGSDLLIAASGLVRSYCPVDLSGSISSAGAAVRNWHGAGTALHSVFNIPSTGGHYWSINGVIKAGLAVGSFDLTDVPLSLLGSPASPGATVRSWHGGGSSTSSYWNIPTGGVYGWQANHVTLATLTEALLTSNVPLQLNAALNVSSGALSLLGSPSSAGASSRNWHGNGGTTNSYFNVPTGGGHYQTINGSTFTSLTSSAFTVQDINMMLSNAYLVFSDVSAFIKPDTSDASDTKQINICGGGTSGSTRGGYACFNGNEKASEAGAIVLEAGNVATGTISLSTGASSRFAIANNGNTTIDTTTATDIRTDILAPRMTVHATVAPATSDNTAAGYPDGSLWLEQDVPRCYIKSSDGGGTAVWTALN